MKDSVLFVDTTCISIDAVVSKKYQGKSYIESLFDPIPDARYLRVTVNADAFYGSSMRDIIDSLIVELEKYKEGF